MISGYQGYQGWESNQIKSILKLLENLKKIGILISNVNGKKKQRYKKMYNCQNMNKKGKIIECVSKN